MVKDFEANNGLDWKECYYCLVMSSMSMEERNGVHGHHICPPYLRI